MLSRNFLSVSANLGTGLFASGILGWMLDSINSRKNDEIVSYKRDTVLKELKTVIQTFLNESGNKYFDLQNLIYETNILERVMDVPVIFVTVKAFENKLLADLGNHQIESEDNIEYLESIYKNDNTLDSLRSLSGEILTDKDLYIVNAIFDEKEIELFDTVNKCVMKLQELFCKSDFINAVSFMDHLYDKLFELVKAVDQFKPLLHLRFDTYTIKNTAKYDG